MVVEQPQFTRVEEPTLLCNHVDLAQFHLYGNGVYQALGNFAVTNPVRDCHLKAGQFPASLG
jgi:hypothetical protein